MKVWLLLLNIVFVRPAHSSLNLSHGKVEGTWCNYNQTCKPSKLSPLKPGKRLSLFLCPLIISIYIFLSVFQPLDFESKKSYNLTVVATNIRADSITGGPYMDQTMVKIIIEDADEPPVFTQSTYLFNVHENAAINTIIGAVAARDQDATHSQVR